MHDNCHRTAHVYVVTWRLDTREKGDAATNFCRSRDGLHLSDSTWLVHDHGQDLDRELQAEVREGGSLTADDRLYVREVYPYRFRCLDVEAREVWKWLRNYPEIDWRKDAIAQQQRQAEENYVGSPTTVEFFVNWDLGTDTQRSAAGDFCKSLQGTAKAESAWEVTRSVNVSVSMLFDELIDRLGTIAKNDRVFVCELK